MFEWISCNQFDRIKEISNAVYSTIWKFSPLNWNIKELIKKSNRIVALKVYLYNEVLKGLNKFRQYQIEDYYNDFEFFILKNFEIFYGKCIKCGKYYTNSEYNWCKPCQINWLKENFMNWTSENEQIDNLIQEIQLSINDYEDAISEWIPYYQFNDIERLDNIVYSAKWENGPLSYNYYNEEYARNSANKSVILKYLVNSQNITNEFLKKIMATYGEFKIYGISQNPKTKDYIIVFNKDQYLEDCCVNCGKNSANKPIILKYLVNSKNITNELLNEIIAYYDKVKIYGISQSPNTKDYIMIFNKDQYLENCCIKCGKYYTTSEYKWCKPCKINWLKENFTNWTSKNEQIDSLIQKMQLLNINNHKDIIFEWISYNQFNDIKVLSNTTYLAIWKDGLLSYNNYYKNEYTRNLTNIAVVLKYLVNSQNITNEFLNEIMAYYDKAKIYGMSQNPKTKDYIMIFNKDQYLKNYCIKCEKYFTKSEYKWCKPCQINWLKENFTNWTSGDEKIDNLIQKKQLEINDYKDITFKWIPYNQFNNIIELTNKIYSAKWKDSLLYWNEKKHKDLNKAVILKYLINPLDIASEFLKIITYYNEIETYVRQVLHKIRV
ncbi:uncharacterized protein OCT59_026930 [Rhizophagus irregularis]|uniref:uncharacterized protein n=1 Tax=Rhizophagus irregularis TaxID=588596 RepID=UPI00332EA1EB|nr:hypothetical protein OCT59_026930 [Rhizophagus irregularis]